MDRVALLIIAFICGGLLLWLELGMRKVEKETQIKVDIHNRAVRLGLYANKQPIDSKVDCFVSDSFLKLNDKGILDNTFLETCQYKNLIHFGNDDLFG